jgi:phosphoribosylanthranilate isomerase
MKNFIRVKICCITSANEAALAVNYGASALGLVSQMPSGPGIISLDEIASIINCIPPSVSAFLLTSGRFADEIIEQQKLTNAGVLQLCDSIDSKVYIRLKEKLNGVKLVQVIHISGEESIREAEQAALFADALLLDSGNPALEIKELGGTGKVHDWKISKQICSLINKPVFLAGGLNPSNISAAMNTVQPFGVDLCSGIRTNGKLDEIKLSYFMKEISKFNFN